MLQVIKRMADTTELTKEENDVFLPNLNDKQDQADQDDDQEVNKTDGDNIANAGSTYDKDDKDDGDLGFRGWLSLIISGYSLVSYLLDAVTDIYLVVAYYNKDMTGYFWATLACVVIPHLLLAVTDLTMLWEDRKRSCEQEDTEDSETSDVTFSDESEKQNQCSQCDSSAGCSRLSLCDTFDCTRDNRMYAFRVILGLLGFGVIVRKLQRLFYTFKWKTTTQEVLKNWYEKKVFVAQRDSSHLAFICAFTENCPQLLLQLYIFVRNPEPIYESIGRSIITSALNLPLAYANYYRSTRRQPKEKSGEIRPDLDTVAFAFYYLGLLGAVVVRVLSIGLFTGAVSVKWGLIVLAVHFIGNVIFIHFYQRPPFAGLACKANECSKCFSITVHTLLYSLVNLFIFVDLNDRTGKKWRIIANYVLLFVENITFVILSFTLVFNEYAMIYGTIIGVGCVVHVIMLSNYYMFLHPTVGDCFNCVGIKSETSEKTDAQVSESKV